MRYFRCPVCGLALEKNDAARRVICPNRHSFDRSRRGYVNLLLSQKADRSAHGDDARMVEARRQFLSRGYYAPLRDALCGLAAKYLRPDGVILDAGCGEGYYTHALEAALEARHPAMLALDISKKALDYAARDDQWGGEYAVASVYHMPVADSSVDLLISVFSPFCSEEFSRVLTPDGVILSVIPLENHLMGLKRVLYEQPYPNAVKPYALEGYRLLDAIELRYLIELQSQEEIGALFGMTPYCYRTSAAGHGRLAALDTLSTPAEFAVLAFGREIARLPRMETREVTVGGRL